MVREDMNHSIAVSFTTNTKSTARRHCGAKEKILDERKFIAEAISFSSPPLVRGTQKTK